MKYIILSTILPLFLFANCPCLSLIEEEIVYCNEQILDLNFSKMDFQTQQETYIYLLGRRDILLKLKADIIFGCCG